MVLTEALIVPFLAGLGLAMLGWRGRRVDDHCLCRRCRFDLTGRPADSSRCPECGVNLDDARDIVVGHRRRRGIPLSVGVTLLVVTLTIAGFAAWGAAAGVRWLRYAPVSYLTWAGVSTNGVRQATAWVELNRRLRIGTLSPADRDRVADIALACEADPAKPWTLFMGFWLADARTHGQLSDVRWQRYLAAAWPTSAGLQVRARVRRGDPIPFWFDTLAARSGIGGAPYADEPNSSFSLDDGPPVRQPFGRPWLIEFASGGATPRTYGDLPLGRHVLHLHMPVSTQSSPRSKIATPAGTVDLSATFNLLPAGQPTVTMIHDPTLASQVRASLLKVDVEARKGGRFVYVGVDVDHTPVGLGFDVFVRAARQPESRMGTIGCAAGTYDHGYSCGGPCPVTVGSKVDVIFRSDPAAAAATPDTFDAWDGELVFKDVVVR